MFSHLAHGGGILAGTPYETVADGGVNEALKPDYGNNPDANGNPDLIHVNGPELVPVRDGLVPDCPSFLGPDYCSGVLFHGDHMLADDPVGSGTKDGADSNLGAPLFSGWPTWRSTTHQQVYWKWLERAWRGGLRLTVQFAVTNEALCRASKHLRDADCTNAMESIAEQTQAAYDFQDFVDAQYAGTGQGWFRIVTTPQEARDAVIAGKLAVVLGIEVADLFGCYFNNQADCTESYVRTQLRDWYDLGIRHIFPVHNFDNGFGGAATWQDAILVGNAEVEGFWWDTEDCSNDGFGFKVNEAVAFFIGLFGFGGLPTPIPAYLEDASCNTKGLTARGEFLIDEMMDLGMIIDVDHMSRKAIDRTLTLAEANDYAGIAASHVQSFGMHETSIRHERMRTGGQLERIRELGGMVAAMLKDDVQDSGSRGQKKTIDFSSSQITDNCRHSSKTFGQAYSYLRHQMQGPVALGSDFNGVAAHVGPRFGSDACGGDNEERLYQEKEGRLDYPFTLDAFGSFDKQVTGQKTFDFNVDGLAHIGLLPDLVADLALVGMQPADMEALFGSADAYIEMWDRANGTFVPIAQAACTDLTVAADDQCQATASVVAGSVSDPRVVVSTSPEGPYGLGQQAVTVTVAPLCGGGVTTCDGTVTVEDQTRPALSCPSGVTEECTGASTIASFTPTATDNCTASLNPSCSPGSGSGFAFGATAVSCTVTDAASNQSTCDFDVTVVDTTNPTASCRNDVVVQLDSSGNGSIAENAIDNGSSDICAGVTFDSDVTNFTCTNVGGNAPVLTVTDAAGLFAQCTAGVTVIDSVQPVALCKSISVTLEQDGTASVPATAINDGSTDACGIAGLSLSPNSFVCATDVGANAVVLTATDANGNQNSCGATVTVLKRPTTLVYQGGAMGQYSDGILLKATLTDTATGNPLSGKTVNFTLGSQSDSATTDGSGVATVSPDLLLNQAATTTSVVTSFSEDCTYLASSDTDSFEIKTEDVTVSFDEANLVAVKVDTDGGDSPPFSLTIYLNETLPDLPDDDTEAPGDIRLAVASMTLVPVGPGGSIDGTCTPQNAGSIAGDSYDDVLEIRCDFDDVSVNVYSVMVTVNDAGYYAGMGEDATVIYDPSLGFTTGGGKLFWPGTLEKTNFGYIMKYNKKGKKVQGNLLVIRHRDDGNIYRLKSNAVTGLAISPMTSSFGWASFNGKGTFKDWDWVDPIGNHEFTVYVEDHGEPGENDRFWLEIVDKDGQVVGVLSMDNPATSEAVTLSGGNIVVPHTPAGD
jgi:microsomal dipeptidase-like Zn-dependent dipeptidase